MKLIMIEEERYYVVYSDGSVSLPYLFKEWAEIMAATCEHFTQLPHSVGIVKVTAIVFTDQKTAA